jgi:PQ loop repeat
MRLSQLLGLAGTGIVAAAYIPQIRHLIKEHCSAGISMIADNCRSPCRDGGVARMVPVVSGGRLGTGITLSCGVTASDGPKAVSHA